MTSPQSAPGRGRARPLLIGALALALAGGGIGAYALLRDAPRSLAECILGSWDVLRSEALGDNGQWVTSPNTLEQSLHFDPDGTVSIFNVETGSDGDYIVSGDQVTISDVPRYPGVVVTWTVASCDDDMLIYSVTSDRRTTLRRS